MRISNIFWQFYGKMNQFLGRKLFLNVSDEKFSAELSYTKSPPPHFFGSAHTDGRHLFEFLHQQNPSFTIQGRVGG